MKTFAFLSVLILPFMQTGAAQAAPAMPGAGAAARTLVEPAQWRYHRKCSWRGGRWIVDLGAGRIVVCRPNRPGRDWIWRDEGPRHGWYHPRRKSWHFRNW